MLQTGQHIFAVTLPVFITPGLDCFPIVPSGPFGDAFTFSVLINECASGEAIELPQIEATTTLLDFSIWVARTTKTAFRRFLLLFRHDVYCDLILQIIPFGACYGGG